MKAVGMLESRRPSVDKVKLTALFRTDSVVEHHSKNGNIEEVSGSRIRLTVEGYSYFNGRLTGSNVAQKVMVPEVEALVKAIKSGKLEERTKSFTTNDKWVEAVARQVIPKGFVAGGAK
jgi:hypothetical protein